MVSPGLHLCIRIHSYVRFTVRFTKALLYWLYITIYLFLHNYIYIYHNTYRYIHSSLYVHIDIYIAILQYIYIYHVVGGFNPSEQYSSVGTIIPNIWKNKIHVPNQQPVYIYITICEVYSILLNYYAILVIYHYR